MKAVTFNSFTIVLRNKDVKKFIDDLDNLINKYIKQEGDIFYDYEVNDLVNRKDFD